MNTTSPPDVSNGVLDYSMASVLCILTCCIFFGNSLVMISIYKFQELQTTTNIYILFLAISDFVVAFSLPYNAIYVIKRYEWNDEEDLCLTRYYFIVHGAATSVLLLLGRNSVFFI